ncbi:unnamed protein product [Discosporangium mesarthrocarpum]
MVRGMMAFLAAFFSLFATLGYLAYGERTEDFVTLNIPRANGAGGVSVALYTVAILLTYPLQLFPAVNCLERHIFRGTKPTVSRTWLKNMLRTSTVLLTALVASFAGDR